MKDAGTLGERLRWARQQQGITLQQLSERCGRAISYLSQLEHGHKVNPTRQTVCPLAEALGVRPAFLLGEVPGPSAADRTPLVPGEQAGSFGREFRRHMASLPEEARLEIAFAMPGRRFAMVVRFLLAEHPESFTSIELAWQLGMSLSQLQEILEHGREVSHPYMEQLSRVSGVPLRFFTHGTLEEQGEAEAPAPAVQAEALRYVEAIRLALERRVSPDKLEALIRAASE